MAQKTETELLITPQGIETDKIAQPSTNPPRVVKQEDQVILAPVSLSDQAKQASNEGALARAESLYTSVLRQEPEDKQARLGLALVLAEQGEFKNAYRELARLALVAPDDVQHLHVRIYLSQLSGDVKSELESIAQLIRAQLIRKNPISTTLNNWLTRMIEQKPHLGDEYVRQQIATMYATLPQFNLLLHNLIALQEQQGQCEKALDAADTILQQQNVPIYVYESLLRCAREQQNFALAHRLVMQAKSTYPKHEDFTLYAALLAVDQGQPELALEQLRVVQLRSKDYYNARAYAWDALGDPVNMAMAYHDLVQRWPNDRTAFVRWFLAFSEAGGAETALERAEAHWQWFSLSQQTTLKHNVTASIIRRALRGHSNPALAQQRNKEALAAVNTHLGWLQQRYPSDANPVIKARFDQVVAHQRANQFFEAIQYYQALQTENIAVPSYVKSSVATAYLALREPQKALTISESVLAQTPTDYSAQAVRYYALLDQESYAAAQTQSLDLQTAQPIWRVSNNDKIWRDNPARLSADRLAAMHLAYESDLAAAQQDFEQKVQAGPANTDLRNDLATVYRYRGWPEAAYDEIDLIRQTEPTLLAANLNSAWILRDLRDYQNMGLTLDHLQQDYPGHAGVKKLEEEWQRLNSYEVFSELSQVQGKGDFFRGDTLVFDNTLYSPPLDYRYRVFAQRYHKEGDFPDKTQGLQNGVYPEIAWDSLSQRIGLEYAYRRHSASIALTDRSTASRQHGVRITQGYRVNDHWQLYYVLDNNSDQTSLGSDYWGITLDRIALSAEYQFNESRQISVTTALSRFSDSDALRNPLTGTSIIDENDRLEFVISHSHPLMENARHRLTLSERLLWLDNENNDSTAYYSPDQLLQFTLGLH